MGIVGTHPGSFRKSGKQRAYKIRNLEECTENGRCFVRSACNRGTQMGAKVLQELKGQRDGQAWLAGTCIPDKVGIFDSGGGVNCESGRDLPSRRQSERQHRLNEIIIAHFYYLSMNTYKWFGC